MYIESVIQNLRRDKRIGERIGNRCNVAEIVVGAVFSRNGYGASTGCDAGPRAVMTVF